MINDAPPDSVPPPWPPIGGFDGYGSCWFQDILFDGVESGSPERQAIEFAAYVGAKELVPFHHDPSHSDETLDDLLENAKREFRPPFTVCAGHEGAVFELGSK